MHWQIKERLETWCDCLCFKNCHPLFPVLVPVYPLGLASVLCNLLRSIILLDQSTINKLKKNLTSEEKFHEHFQWFAALLQLHLHDRALPGIHQ